MNEDLITVKKEKPPIIQVIVTAVFVTIMVFISDMHKALYVLSLAAILFAIPCVGLILAIVFACGAVKNKNLVNWARAQLIILGVVIAIYVLLMILGIGTAVLNSATTTIPRYH